MTGSSSDRNVPGRQQSDGGTFPLSALIALALAGFITILTEAIPAGLLPQIAESLSVSHSDVGQMVTVYAIGSLVAAVPLTSATQGVRRRRLLASAIAGFALANSVTAFSPAYALTIVARFVAGISAGLLWALLAGYAARMVPDDQKGRAIAVAMVGTPVALSIGVPAATFLGSVVGWRTCFAMLSAVAGLLVIWVATKLPDFPGQRADKSASLSTVMRIAGVPPILFTTLAFVLAHNMLYTYIAPFLLQTGLQDEIDIVLFVFGGFSLIGIWGVGVFIDRKLRLFALLSSSLFIIAAAALGLGSTSPSIVLMAVAIWGIAFGGAATLFQTALARTAGEATDVAQSMLVTAWNLAIAGGGLLGGLLLDHVGVDAFAPTLLGLLIPCLLAIWAARRHGFPPSS
ncbi:putative MFS family arabinose efflux permease [Mesorhizobium soli]|uniref:MFS transporter n=1 Tax=Pseudaminobacter soli (ex Li et al. 2025) TaxID=1295366 RepID=UPI0024731F19|nr:MFS transporter [Mesorhizobium soli]MDH6232988.1 putative MFS family arabinose efflux permease [Mesorhizobium soli]